jgi:hypothetical protein
MDQEILAMNIRFDIGDLAGKPIRPRFALKDADIVAFGFQDKPRWAGSNHAP